MVLALAIAAACGGDDPKGTSLNGVPFTASDGRQVTLSDLGGTPLVVNLWATWCGPCLKEMPAFDQVAGEQGDRVHLIGINVADSPADAAAFAADLGVSYDQFTDPDGALSTALSVTGLPATAFIDADGTLIEVHQGAYTAQELTAAIDRHFPTSGSEGTQP